MATTFFGAGFLFFCRDDLPSTKAMSVCVCVCVYVCVEGAEVGCGNLSCVDRAHR